MKASKSSDGLLFGRERETRVLDELICSASEHGAALVVRGEAGVGKSALLASVSAHAKAQGMPDFLGQ